MADNQIEVIRNGKKLDSKWKASVQSKPEAYELSYACLLIPRMPSHYLIGDVSYQLSEWLKQICISFSWQLESPAVRPEYLQWVVSVPAATPPSRVLRVIRQELSRRIFADFPVFKKENKTDDFWAPGYFVLIGNQPHPEEMIEEYIKLTRQQRGRLAGDETTDAPPPAGKKKKKRKGM